MFILSRHLFEIIFVSAVLSTWLTHQPSAPSLELCIHIMCTYTYSTYTVQQEIGILETYEIRHSMFYLFNTSLLLFNNITRAINHDVIFFVAIFCLDHHLEGRWADCLCIHICQQLKSTFSYHSHHPMYVYPFALPGSYMAWRRIKKYGIRLHQSSLLLLQH